MLVERSGPIHFSVGLRGGLAAEQQRQADTRRVASASTASGAASSDRSRLRPARPTCDAHAGRSLHDVGSEVPLRPAPVPLSQESRGGWLTRFRRSGRPCRRMRFTLASLVLQIGLYDAANAIAACAVHLSLPRSIVSNCLQRQTAQVTVDSQQSCSSTSKHFQPLRTTAGSTQPVPKRYPSTRRLELLKHPTAVRAARKAAAVAKTCRYLGRRVAAAYRP